MQKVPGVRATAASLVRGLNCKIVQSRDEHLSNVADEQASILETAEIMADAEAMKALRQGPGAAALQSVKRAPRRRSISAAGLGAVLLLTAGCGTTAPDTPTPGVAFHSGGIGLTLAEWQQHHRQDFPGTPRADGDTSYDHDQYSVEFWHRLLDQGTVEPGAPIVGVSVDTRGQTLEQMRADALPLLPDDARLESSGRNGEYLYDDYYSPSLPSRYPPLKGPDIIWPKEGPGFIAVVYVDVGAAQSFITINAPYPIPAIPTAVPPTPCPGRPCPTPTLPGPPPTAIGLPSPVGTVQMPAPPASGVPALAPATPTR